MTRKCLVVLSIICFTLAQVNSEENPGRLLKCWPRKLKYHEFNVQFYSSSRNKSYQLIKEDSRFGRTDIDFKPRRRTTVLVHGFMDSAQKPLMRNLANNLLAWKDMNVLIVDWSAGCSQLLQYHQASVNTEFVAIQIKNFFKQLKKHWIAKGRSLDDWGPLHFIGFSLGAHVVGQAAELLRIEENLLVDRVTGLDPAEPCFEDYDIPIRLSKKNARFVDVIHTDAARGRNNAFGLRDPIGHADFYVNGGSVQPGCNYRRKRAAEYEYAGTLFLHGLTNGACHHARAVQVFTDSVAQAVSNQCKYWAHPWNLSSNQVETRRILSKACDASMCPEMGINADIYDYQSKERNTFYVATTGSAPYCKKST